MNDYQYLLSKHVQVDVLKGSTLDWIFIFEGDGGDGDGGDGLGDGMHLLHGQLDPIVMSRP